MISARTVAGAVGSSVCTAVAEERCRRAIGAACPRLSQFLLLLYYEYLHLVRRGSAPVIKLYRKTKFFMA